MTSSDNHGGDDEYTRATKAVVDDTMRTDVLGPNIERVLRDHKPANDLIETIIVDAVTNNTKVKKAIDSVVDSNENRKRNSIIIAVGGAIGGAILMFIGNIIIEAMKKS